jgi:hypothetical protein
MNAYREKMHLYGRIFIILGIFMMFLIPVTTWLITGIGPDFNQLVVGVIALSVLFLPGGIAEVVTYGPILGTSGTYLAFITGNLVNLKIPCVMNAREIAKTQINTDENEVVSTVAVSASTITTIAIMVSGVLLLQPLKPFLESEVLRPAFLWVVSALFGALAYKYVKGHVKYTIVPLIFVVIVSILAPNFLQKNLVVVILLTIVVAIISSWIIFQKTMKASDPS